LLTDRKANNYARAERTLVSIEWQDNLPATVSEQAYAMALAEQIESVLMTESMTVAEILEELNEELDDEAQKVKGDSVRKALRRSLHSRPPRFAVSGKGSTARWALGDIHETTHGTTPP